MFRLCEFVVDEIVARSFKNRPRHHHSPGMSTSEKYVGIRANHGGSSQADRRRPFAGLPSEVSFLLIGVQHIDNGSRGRLLTLPRLTTHPKARAGGWKRSFAIHPSFRAHEKPSSWLKGHRSCFKCARLDHELSRVLLYKRPRRF